MQTSLAPFWYTPNLFVTVALVLWPFVALILYRTKPVNQATLWTILGGYLLLPADTAIKFEMIPQFDKVSIPNFAALIGCMLALKRLPRFGYGFGLPEALLLMMLAGPFVTSELNTDSIAYDRVVLPAETQYDAVSTLIMQFIFLIPFFLGRQFFRNAADNEQILRVLVVAGLIYSLPMLFEIRMSPQLHTLVYGYYPQASFGSELRDGGYRPVVFLGHGLLVAFFAMTAAVAAAAFWRTRTVIMRLPAGGVTAYLALILLLCKSLASLIYGAALIPLVRLVKPRTQVRVAVILAAIVFSYPLLRAVDLVPTDMMVDAAQSIDAERVFSLKTRLNNEENLLEHASQRIIFGWGRFGRNRVYDTETGRDTSLTDGRWIITLGSYGLVGFLGEFGLLALAVFRAGSALRFTKPDNGRIYFAALTLIVAINMVDLLPNATLSPWTWLLAGSLVGRAEALRGSRWVPNSKPLSSKYAFRESNKVL